ncbi:nitrogen fixation protein NifQ [Cupriavidus sp. BIC8F]|uniref:nitrogen fixation protein NifQ n=1 Tax=Cupriavidus sp. BIC8F TaxID=3079014 RepID=UPI00291667D6|nr:nitrogen fixation protein NifQ [Cupriavidus sp. BIC8F]
MNRSLLLLDAFAAHPGDAVSRALSGVLESAAAGCLPRFAQWLGLPPDEFRLMLDACFPGAATAGWQPDAAPADPGALPCEFGDLVEMLWSGQSAGADPRLVRWAAHALACGCFGRTHLWQDMGLSGREDVSNLLRQMFEPVFLGNTTDMKWKKFFYHRVCERLDLHPCPEPSCSGCDQFENCHGSEARVGASQPVSMLTSAKP